MTKFAVTAVAAAALAACGLGLAVEAGAMSLAGAPADQPALVLESEGNALSWCTVLGVGELRGMRTNGVFDNPDGLRAASIELTCPSAS